MEGALLFQFRISPSVPTFLSGAPKNDITSLQRPPFSLGLVVGKWWKRRVYQLCERQNAAHINGPLLPECLVERLSIIRDRKSWFQSNPMFRIVPNVSTRFLSVAYRKCRKNIFVLCFVSVIGNGAKQASRFPDSSSTLSGNWEQTCPVQTRGDGGTWEWNNLEHSMFLGTERLWLGGVRRRWENRKKLAGEKQD